MTILGKQTVAETRHIMKLTEFRIEQVLKLMNGGHLPFSAENAKLINDWNEWTDRWTLARDKALEGLLSIKLQAPLANDDILPSQKQWDDIVTVIGTPKDEIALNPLVRRFQAATGETIDETGRPMPPDYDPDLQAYRKVDAQIKAGEQAAKAAADATKKAASSNTGLLVLGGAVLAIGGVVAIKVYL